MHGFPKPPTAAALLLAACPLANSARASGIPALGSTVGSNAGTCKRGHTLDAGRSASQDAGQWPKAADRDYAGDVPREVLAPEGAAREAPVSLSGILVCLHRRPRWTRRRQFPQSSRIAVQDPGGLRPNRPNPQLTWGRARPAAAASGRRKATGRRRQGRRLCRFTSTGEGEEGSRR